MTEVPNDKDENMNTTVRTSENTLRQLNVLSTLSEMSKAKLVSELVSNAYEIERQEIRAKAVERSDSDDD